MISYSTSEQKDAHSDVDDHSRGILRLENLDEDLPRVEVSVAYKKTRQQLRFFPGQVGSARTFEEMILTSVSTGVTIPDTRDGQ